MRTITTTLDNILSLISTATDYGFNDTILMNAFAEMLNHKLRSEGIEVYARAVEAMDWAWGEEDYEKVKQTLERFKIVFINQTKEK